MVVSRITVLAEDTANGRDLLAEHGLAFWIEFGHDRILFDTGQGKALYRNARGILSNVLDEVLSSRDVLEAVHELNSSVQ